jgi:hypothetical protein
VAVASAAAKDGLDDVAGGVPVDGGALGVGVASGVGEGVGGCGFKVIFFVLESVAPSGLVTVSLTV